MQISTISIARWSFIPEKLPYLRVEKERLWPIWAEVIRDFRRGLVEQNGSHRSSWALIGKRAKRDFSRWESWVEKESIRKANAALYICGQVYVDFHFVLLQEIQSTFFLKLFLKKYLESHIFLACINNWAAQCSLVYMYNSFFFLSGNTLLSQE